MKIFIGIILAALCLISAVEMWKQIVERYLMGIVASFILLMNFTMLLVFVIGL